MGRFGHVGWAFLVLGILTAGQASAGITGSGNPLPGARYTITLSDAFGSFTAPGSYSATNILCNGISCSSEDSSITIPTGPGFDPTLSIDGSAMWDLVTPISASAEAKVVYFFEVTGPTSTMVPILLSTSAQNSGTVSSVTVTGSDGGKQFDYNFTCGGPCATNGFAFDVTANTEAQVVMDINGSVSLPDADILNLAGESFSGTVDPMIVIDPAFAGTNPDYNLEFSPATSAAVPEPATWAFLFLGFFGVGAMVRYARSGARALA